MSQKFGWWAGSLSLVRTSGRAHKNFFIFAVRITNDPQNFSLK
jgi:hypothetical protein